MRKFALILLLTMPLFGSRPAIATDCAGKTTCCDRCGRQAAVSKRAAK